MLASVAVWIPPLPFLGVIQRIDTQHPAHLLSDSVTKSPWKAFLTIPVDWRRTIQSDRGCESDKCG